MTRRILISYFNSTPSIRERTRRTRSFFPPLLSFSSRSQPHASRIDDTPPDAKKSHRRGAVVPPRWINARARRTRRTRRLARTGVREKMIGVLVKLAGFGVGYLYPMYSALKLLDRKVIGPEDVTLWLTYFIVAYSLLIGENTGLVSW